MMKMKMKKRTMMVMMSEMMEKRTRELLDPLPQHLIFGVMNRMMRRIYLETTMRIVTMRTGIMKCSIRPVLTQGRKQYFPKMGHRAKRTPMWTRRWRLAGERDAAGEEDRLVICGAEGLECGVLV